MPMDWPGPPHVKREVLHDDIGYQGNVSAQPGLP